MFCKEIVWMIMWLLVIIFSLISQANHTHLGCFKLPVGTQPNSIKVFESASFLISQLRSEFFLPFSSTDMVATLIHHGHNQKLPPHNLHPDSDKPQSKSWLFISATKATTWESNQQIHNTNIRNSSIRCLPFFFDNHEKWWKCFIF